MDWLTMVYTNVLSENIWSFHQGTCTKDTEQSVKNYVKTLLNAHGQVIVNHRIIISIPLSFVPSIDLLTLIT